MAEKKICHDRQNYCYGLNKPKGQTYITNDVHNDKN